MSSSQSKKEQKTIKCYERISFCNDDFRFVHHIKWCNNVSDSISKVITQNRHVNHNSPHHPVAKKKKNLFAPKVINKWNAISTLLFIFFLYFVFSIRLWKRFSTKFVWHIKCTRNFKWVWQGWQICAKNRDRDGKSRFMYQ